MKQILLKLALLIVLLLPFGVEKTNSFFSSETTVPGVTFSTTCWTAPSFGNWVGPLTDSTSALNVFFGWPIATTSCPITTLTYLLQIYRDPALKVTDNIFQLYGTDFYGYTINSMPEGEYWWRVTVIDDFGNSSPSGVFHLTVDRTAPSASLSISGSWSKLVEEKIVNGKFTDGLNGWDTSGDVTVLASDSVPASTVPGFPSVMLFAPSGGEMARLGRPIYSGDSGNMVWENRLMQSFAAGAKSLSVDYQYFSRDNNSHDDPGFFVRLNGQEVFRLSDNNVNPFGLDDGLPRSSGWKTFSYDLSSFTNGSIDLALYSGNTEDRTAQSWTYISKVSTYFVAAPTHAAYTIHPSDLRPIDYCEYRIDGGVWKRGTEFSIASGGSHKLQYHCFDRAGNVSPLQEVVVITDVTPPSKVEDLTVTAPFPNLAILHWSAPGNDGSSGKATRYDIRYSTNPIIDNSSFDKATRLESSQLPKDSGLWESFEVSGLSPDTQYYFALRASDEAANWSEISNVISVTTPISSQINFGDVVINELMWMGTGAGSDDEYLELRNATDKEIDLTGLELRYQSEGAMEHMATLSGKIPAKGYFLITHYGTGTDNTHLKSSVNSDLILPGLSLSSLSLKIELVDPFNADNLIDRAWDGSNPVEGLHIDPSKHYSMERILSVADGSNLLSWYTSMDPASTGEFFTGASDDRGTPGKPNRSESWTDNSIIPATESAEIAATEAAMPKLTLTMAADSKSVSFEVENITDFNKLEYELTYNTDTVSPQGVIGNVDLAGESNILRNITLGTCSTGGIVCVYHTGVYDVVLNVRLVKSDGFAIILKGIL